MKMGKWGKVREKL